MSTISELITKINKEYEKSKEPDKGSIKTDIESWLIQLRPSNGYDSFWVRRENVDIHPDIRGLHISLEPSKEPPLTITYDKQGGYQGVDWQFMTYEQLAAFKEKLADIFQHILDQIEYDKIEHHYQPHMYENVRPRVQALLDLAKRTNSIDSLLNSAIKKLILSGNPNDPLWIEDDIDTVARRATEWLENLKDHNLSDKDIDEMVKKAHEEWVKKQMALFDLKNT